MRPKPFGIDLLLHGLAIWGRPLGGELRAGGGRRLVPRRMKAGGVMRSALASWRAWNGSVSSRTAAGDLAAGGSAARSALASAASRLCAGAVCVGTPGVAGGLGGASSTAGAASTPTSVVAGRLDGPPRRRRALPMDAGCSGAGASWRTR